jgi:hypothetical protein
VPHNLHREGERACVKLTWFPSGARQAIWFDDLNDPRPGGHATLKERRGLDISTYAMI